MNKFNPTPENLDTLVKSLRLQDIEYLLEKKLLACSLETATKYQYILTSQGAEKSITTTGVEFLKSQGISMRNLRGEFIK